MTLKASADVFRLRLAAMRRHRKLTIEQFCELMQIRTESYRDIVKAKRVKIDLRLIIRAAEILDTSVAWLVGELPNDNLHELDERDIKLLGAVQCYRHWTTTEERKLVLLRKQGLPLKQIAVMLDRTTNAVTIRLNDIYRRDRQKQEA